MTEGLGVPSTPTWNGNRSTAPETPAGLDSRGERERSHQGADIDPSACQPRLTVPARSAAPKPDRDR